MSRDQKFFDMYSLVIGVLAAVGLALFVLSMKMADLTQGAYTRDAAEYQAAVMERIKPVGEVYLPGDEYESAAAAVSAVPEPDPVATAMSGPQVYNSACLVCHGAGIGGAPILGDAAMWSARVEQGIETLHTHAIEGYVGESGLMPAKGGRMDLSDDEVRAAVQYMVDEVN